MTLGGLLMNDQVFPLPLLGMEAAGAADLPRWFRAVRAEEGLGPRPLACQHCAVVSGTCTWQVYVERK